MRFAVSLSLVCFVGVVAFALPAAAQLEESVEGMGALLGQKPKPFIDPAGYWSAILPVGFDCQAKERSVKCSGNRGVQSSLSIDVVDVPASATAEIVMLNQMDKFKKKPHFKMLQKGKIAIDGSPAILINFAYDYLGNVEHAVGVEELIFVRGGKLYLIHQEMRLSQLAAHKKDLEQLYRSFRPARVDAAGNPMIEDLNPAPATAQGLPSEIEKALQSPF